jgi:hypothetical protein
MLKVRTAMFVASLILGAAPAAASITKDCMFTPKGPVCPTTLSGASLTSITGNLQLVGL